MVNSLSKLQFLKHKKSKNESELIDLKENLYQVISTLSINEKIKLIK